MKNKNLCIIQARMGAARLPGKVLKKVKGLTLLEYEISRVKQAKEINKIVVATSDKNADDKIEKLCKKINIDCFRGSENNVLNRYYKCSLQYPHYENIIRITGDCPLIDPIVIDSVIAFFEKNKFDYASNVLSETFPDGMDTEIFTREALRESAQKATLNSELEHVTQYIVKNNNFKKGNFTAEYDWSHFRLTIDNPEDFEVISFLIRSSKITDGYLNYIALLTRHPDIMLKNSHIARNEGLRKSVREDGKD